MASRNHLLEFWFPSIGSLVFMEFAFPLLNESKILICHQVVKTRFLNKNKRSMSSHI